MSEAVEALVVPAGIREDAVRLGFEIEEETWKRLGRYLGLLLATNQTMNLTAIREPEAAWSRLILDSLTVLPAFESLPEEQARVLDVGTGGGLPGMPLAIARPDLSFTLVDSTQKKIGFLNEVADRLGLTRVKAVAGRAETLGHQSGYRQQFDLVVSRAVGPLPVLLEFTLPFVRVGGWCVAMKGPKAEQELADSGDALAALGGGEVQVVEAYPESFENDLVLVLIQKDRATPKTYPREPGLPKRSPL
ncbi:16S rRNA (guanine(527)-N(7))-methyltransferase RsmG [Mucisphaera sp.]|uniref:16S rRNA (guanine(527)-N(7))-methyltransferase RsmG n=1 Tax=Mucisphaera sp. TaxID=2913024 RepID=UPI003D0F1D74